MTAPGKAPSPSQSSLEAAIHWLSECDGYTEERGPKMLAESTSLAEVIDAARAAGQREAIEAVLDLIRLRKLAYDGCSKELWREAVTPQEYAQRGAALAALESDVRALPAAKGEGV